MNQWIFSLLRPQLQMETVRGFFLTNLEEYLNSTNKKIINRFIYDMDICLRGTLSYRIIFI